MGGGGSDPGADARAMEAERQGRIKAATEQINRIFSGATQQTKTRTVPGAMLTPATAGNANSAYVMPGTNYSPTSAEGRAFAVPRQQEQYARSTELGQEGNRARAQYDAAQRSGAPGYGPTAATYAPDTTETYTEWVDPAGGNPREALYADQRKNVYDINSQEVNRQATEAERNTRFGLARAGLAGGSADVWANSELNRRTNEGLLRAGGIADQSSADLRTADERTRANLISMAQSGIDTGSASQMALGGLKANADAVAAQRSGSTIGSLFDDISNAYLINQQARGTNAGMYGNQSYGVSDPRKGYGGTKG
jgi:hypothetical protein